MSLVPTEALSEPSELQTTTGHMLLAARHSQSHDQKTGQTESPFFGLNLPFPVDLHPLGEMEKYGQHKLNKTNRTEIMCSLLCCYIQLFREKIRSNYCFLV